MINCFNYVPNQFLFMYTVKAIEVIVCFLKQLKHSLELNFLRGTLLEAIERDVGVENRLTGNANAN